MKSPTAIEAALPSGAPEWVREHVATATPVELIRDSARSVVARWSASVGGADLFFKADRILPPPECAVLTRIAAYEPARVVPVIAVDERRGWSLTRDVGPHGLDGASTEDWCRLVQQFAELQRGPDADVDRWLQIGCRDLRGERLHAAFVAMLDDAAPFLDDAEREALGALRPRIAERCEALAHDGVPPALVHQDLVPENVVYRDGESVFLDWSDTVVAHPFFGCDRLLDSCWTDAERKAAVIDSYLAAFSGVAPEQQLRASFQNMLWLRVLYEDVRWHHEIRAAAHDVEHVTRLRKDLVLGLGLVARAQS